MKKITILMMILVGFLAVSCSSPSSAEKKSDTFSEETTAKIPACMVELKINGVLCTADYPTSGVYDFNITDYHKLMIDKDYTGNNEALKYVEKFTESRQAAFWGSIVGGSLKYIIKDEYRYNMDEEVLKILFPSDDGKIKISDLRYCFYFEDQHGVKKDEGDGVYRKIEKNLPQWYIDNKGSNNFKVRDDIMNYLSVWEGKIIEEADDIYDTSSEITEKKVNFECKYLIPEDIWSNKNYYKTVESYIYDVDFIYQGYSGREVYKWKIDLKKLMEGITSISDGDFVKSDSIIFYNTTNFNKEEPKPVKK